MTAVAAAALSACPDLLFALDPSGVWLASNPRARSHAAVSPDALELLRRLAAGARLPAAAEGLKDLWAEDRTIFGCRRCLLDDATGLDHDSHAAERVSGLDAVVALLAQRDLLIPSLEAYLERFGPKRRLIDPARLGNFHQQLGHELLLRQRAKPEAWWVSQKFADDLRSIKPTAYQKVQEQFMRREAPKWGLSGKRVLDAGCGVGYYSAFFAGLGATVLGVDPDAAHIERATKTFGGPNASFRVFDFKEPGSLAALPGAPFDFIYLSDVLLFYFTAYQDDPAVLTGAAGLLKALKGLLAPGGRIMVMDPHGSFSLCLRLGDPARPIAALPEYRRKRYGIAPNLGQLAGAFREAGLAITGLWEPAYEGPVKDREDAFLAEFPTWWVFELRPAP